MNKQNIHTLIDRYEQNYYIVNNQEHDEKFKWEAVQCFRNAWFQNREKKLPFSKLFDLSMKKSSLLINNSMVSPTNGIVKMAEQRPEEIERLVRDGSGIVVSQQDENIAVQFAENKVNYIIST